MVVPSIFMNYFLSNLSAVLTEFCNTAQDKKVQQEKNHNEEIAPDADKTPQPRKKTHMEHRASDIAKVPYKSAPVPTAE